jgi:hypothetical protein
VTIAGYSYLDLQEEVLAFQFQPAKYRPLVKRWLNQAQRHIVISSEIRTQQAAESVVTTTGDSSYVMPANFARLIDFFYPAEPGLITPDDIRDFDTLPESSGRPTVYTVRDNELILYPTPDAIYSFTLRYWKLPIDMVADTDTPELPVQDQELLVAYPMWKCYLRENDYVAAKEWQAIWETGLLKLRGEAQGDVFDGPRQVAGTWGDPHDNSTLGRG